MASIFLAVGHGVSTNGNWDSGCVDGSYTEAGLMFDIVGVAVRILRQHGVIVGTDWDTAERCFPPEPGRPGPAPLRHFCLSGCQFF